MADIREQVEELENYFLILAAFEDNLAEYKKIKNKLVEVSCYSQINYLRYVSWWSYLIYLHHIFIYM